MANKDLSQNIELNVSVNPQSIAKAQSDIDSLSNSADVRVNLVADTKDFMTELRKELGFGESAKIRVGGYSTGESPDRVIRNKAARKVEKMGGDWSGVDIADKAEVAAAKNINEAAKELANRLGIKFTDQFASIIGEADFAIPREDLPVEQLRKTIEDFIVDAAGGVTISPAMLLAAAENVYKKNPGISVPGGPVPSLDGAISPTGIFPPGANFDDKVTEEFNAFLSNAIGSEADAAAVREFLAKKLKVVFSDILDAGQKAREGQFRNAKVSEGEDSAENMVRYGDDAARAAIALEEIAAGLQPGTAAAYSRGSVPEWFKSKPEALSDPAQLANVLVGEYKDKVTGELMSSLPDPKKVADPIAQVLMNPYILGDKFVSEYQKQVRAAIKKGPEGIPVAATKPTTPAVDATPSIGVRESKVEDITRYLSDMKEKVTAAGREFVIGFDTEFNKQIPNIITEASLRIRNEAGDFVKIFDMFHAPTPEQAKNMASGAFADNPKSIGELKGLAGAAGYKEPVGSEDVLQNFLELQAKVRNLSKVLQVAADLDIPVTGSNIQGAEWSQSLVPLINSINGIVKGNKNLTGHYKEIADALEQSGITLGTIHVPQPKLRDSVQMAKAAAKAGSADAKVLLSGNQDPTKQSATLGNLLKNTVEFFGDRLSQEVKDVIEFTDKGFSIGGKGSHTAAADAEASVIVHDVMMQLDKFGSAVETTTKTVSTKAINAANAGAGSGGGKPPVEPPAGGGFAARAEANEPSVKRLASTYKELDQMTRSLTSSEAELVRIAQDRQTNTKASTEVMRQAVDASRGLASADKILFGEESKLEVISSERIKDLASYSSSISENKDAVAALARIEAAAVNGEVKRSDVIKDVYTVQKAYNTSMYEATQLAKKSEFATREEIKAEQRKGQVKEELTQNLRKQIDEELRLRHTTDGASKAIAAIYKDQVEAEKAVQAATKASINQWVTGRYALYDVANAYQNVSRQLFQVSRRIFDLTNSYRSYETAFTSVERAMQLDFSSPAGGARELKEQFIELSERIPVAFEELSRIATLGAQMGIGAKGIENFTETVAQFAAVTGISADTVAQKFGKIAELTNLDTGDFSKLGSAVAFAGVNAVATESEILTLSESIAAVSSQVGVTSAEVVGLGTALSSVGIPAEQARGVFTRVFADIDRAVSSGNDAIASLGDTSGMTQKQIKDAFKDKNALTAFAEAANMSVDQFSAAWGTDGKSYDVFRAILGGINSAGDLTEAFDRLGIVETREINTLTRLANNLNVVDQAVGDATASFGDGQFLLESFEKTTDNLDSKIVIFQSNLKSLAEQLSQMMGGGLKVFLDGASEVTKVLKQMAESPVLQALSLTSLAFTAIGGVAVGLASVLAKVVAQIYAFRVAMVNSANDPTAISGIGKQIKQLTNFRSGLIEMRSELLAPNAGVRGNLQPIDYGVFGKAETQMKKHLELNNLYIASGDKVLASLDKRQKAEQGLASVSSLKNATDQQKIFLARSEADQINKLVQERKNEIENLKLVTDTSKAAGKAKIAEATSSQILYRWVNGEAVAYTQAEVARAKGIVSGQIMANTKQKEAAAHVLNANAINAETQAASKASSGVVGIGSKVMGALGAAGIAVSVLTTVWGIIDGIRIATEQANKLDLAGSGLTVEALKETIKQDTQAWMDNGQAIATQSSAYVQAEAKTNKYAASVKDLDSSLKETYGSQLDMVDVTKQQTVAFGDATKQLIINSILANEKIRALIDNNKEMFNDLAGIGFNGSDMINAIMGDPDDAQAYLDKIQDGIKDIDAQIAAANTRIAANVNGNMVTGDISVDSANVDQLRTQREELKALGQAGAEALKQIEKAVAMQNLIDMMNGYSQEYVGLENKLKNAVKSGKGYTAVLKQIAAATIAASAAAAVSDGFAVDVNSAKTVQELYDIVKAEHEFIISTKRAKAVAEGRWGDFGSVTSGLEGSVRSLGLLAQTAEATADSVADSLGSAGEAAESLTDKLKRLLEVANGFVSGAMGMNSALRTLGSSFKDSKSWSIGTEGGSAKISGILGVITEIGNRANGNFPKAIRELQAFKIVLTEMGAPASAIAYVNRAINKIGGDSTLTAAQVAKLKKEFPSLFATMRAQIESGAKPFKTLTDYVGELRGAISSAFDIRYGKQTALDAITKSWMSMKDSANEAAKAVKSANDEINGLTADKSILEYQLSVAERYNDERRAAVIRAKLAKVNGDLADAQTSLSEAQSSSSTELKGDSKAAIENRAKIRELVQTYNSYLTSLANTGMSAEDLKKEAAKLSTEFLAQGKSMGFAEADLLSYTDAFKNDFTTVINNLPTNITLEINTDPALRAIEEFVKQGNTALSGLDFSTGTVAKTNADKYASMNSVDKAAVDWRVRRIANLKKELPSAKTAAAKAKIQADIDMFTRQKDAIYARYAGGGYVSGSGGSKTDSIPAMLSNGEYVLQASSVKAYGVDFLNSLNQQRVSFQPVQPSAQPVQQSGPQMVYLSPEDRALLRQAVDRPVNLYTENQKIASSANAGNVILAQRGAR